MSLISPCFFLSSNFKHSLFNALLLTFFTLFCVCTVECVTSFTVNLKQNNEKTTDDDDDDNYILCENNKGTHFTTMNSIMIQ